MIRLVSGDRARWVDEPCPCGGTYPRLPRGLDGRFDDMIIVRGENVYPGAIEDTLRAIDGFGGEFRVIVSRREAMDEKARRVIDDRDLYRQALHRSRAPRTPGKTHEKLARPPARDPGQFVRMSAKGAKEPSRHPVRLTRSPGTRSGAAGMSAKGAKEPSRHPVYSTFKRAERKARHVRRRRDQASDR
jgi:acyl-CoA synthetase (AMP-forming)/AMP-acid ligase II